MALKAGLGSATSRALVAAYWPHGIPKGPSARHSTRFFSPYILRTRLSKRKNIIHEPRHRKRQEHVQGHPDDCTQAGSSCHYNTVQDIPHPHMIPLLHLETQHMLDCARQ